MNTLSSWNNRLVGKKAEVSVLNSQLSEATQELVAAGETRQAREEAQKYIQTAAELTQQLLEKQLSDIVTPALAAVVTDKDPYTFKANFVQRRGTIECDLMFERDGELLSPVEDAGLGTADIASIALKVAYREASDTRPILITDEIGKNVSVSYRALFAALLKRISHDLGIQLIMITHNDEMKREADKLIMVTMEGEVSKIQ